MGVIYRPWTGITDEDMKHVRIFDSFEDMQRQIAKEHRVDQATILDGGYSCREMEDLETGFMSSKYLCIHREKYIPIDIGLFSLIWDEDRVNKYAHIREGVIYRPSCGSLADAMEKVMYFNSFEDLQKYIAEEYSCYMNLKPEELVLSGNSIYDDRIGWMDSNYLCVDSYKKINDKEGYEKFFGGKYNSPQCIGFVATKWNRDQPNGILKSPGVWVDTI